MPTSSDGAVRIRAHLELNLLGPMSIQNVGGGFWV